MLWLRGEFGTLSEIITALRRAMANEAGSWIGWSE